MNASAKLNYKITIWGIHIGKVISAASSIERAGAGAINAHDNSWIAPTMYGLLRDARGMIAILANKLQNVNMTKNILNLLILAAQIPNKIAEIGETGLFKMLYIPAFLDVTPLPSNICCKIVWKVLKTPTERPVDSAIKIKEQDLNISLIELQNDDLYILADGEGGFFGASLKNIKPITPVMLQ